MKDLVQGTVGTSPATASPVDITHHGWAKFNGPVSTVVDEQMRLLVLHHHGGAYLRRTIRAAGKGLATLTALRKGQHMHVIRRPPKKRAAYASPFISVPAENGFDAFVRSGSARGPCRSMGCRIC